MSDVQFIDVNGEKLQFSSKITFQEKENNISIHIHNTVANMQEDSSNFESIIICIWSVDRNKTITLKFDSYTGEYDKDPQNKGKKWTGLKQPSYIGGKGIAYAEPARLHYMRFLYRVMRFREIYQNRGFCLDNTNVSEVDKFEKLYKNALHNGELWITKPTTKGDIKGYDEDSDSIANTDEVAENHLEKWFMSQSENNNLPDQIVAIFGNNRLYDQFPCCMFIGEPSSCTRIFNAGYIDLWGINDSKELCVFELKKEGNEKLGIISELFFYSMIMKDMKEASKNKYLRIRNNQRGFKDFISIENDKCINAYFLVPKLHKYLKNKKFISILNECDSSIKFDLITFSQEDIVKNNPEVFFNELVHNMKGKNI